MLDIQTNPADSLAGPAAVPAAIQREDYLPPDWLVPEITLDFLLDADHTEVSARLTITRNHAHNRPLVLEGEALELLSVSVDGSPLAHEHWPQGDAPLSIALSGDNHIIETRVAISPAKNSQLMGLYASGGLLCTQCEAEGFRRITYFPDRPDVLSRYSVRMEANRALYPVLLANGDPIASGEAANGRHWAQWNDPFPKPCYLFALVAGDLACNLDSFTTMGGREVKLGIWVREADLPRTNHAMTALKNSMAWDERAYGREYDLDVFNIVAVSDFNFGAMENKGLNIFNSRYILVDPETATDFDYDAVEGVVAHEYFHNWSGNRVTCRDWFQLSLKEGLTVYRDQCFSADMGSQAVKRIEDVRTLRAAQFPEDSGPLAHPIRPDSYMEISNFYTATVYNKGAEVIRMMATMLGEERYRKGTDLYFERYDGQAVTCEDFVVAMEQGGDIDLSQFRLWYSQAGTPRVSAVLLHDPATRSAILTLSQSVPDTPGQIRKKPMVVPLRTALFDRQSAERKEERLLLLTEAEQSFRFENIATPPVLSINRGFSAPVLLDVARDSDELAFLAAHDDDPFARYEAMQQLMVSALTVAVASGAPPATEEAIEAVRNALTNPDLDDSFIAEAVRLPSEAYIGDQMLVVEPQAIHDAREALMHAIGKELESIWRDIHASRQRDAFSLSPSDKGARKLRNVALSYLMAGGAADASMLALTQYEDAHNMTERQGAFATLTHSAGAERDRVIADFYDRYHDNALVLDKWFQTQALAFHPDIIAIMRELGRHPDFTLTNPNRVRSLWGSFAANQWAFHSGAGEGYAMLADMIIALDPINPQTAARFVPPLGRWRRFSEERGTKMREALQRVLAQPKLSKDVTEQVTKSLAG
jgi:aminopeptidase N